MVSVEDLHVLATDEDIETHIFELHSISATSSNQDLGLISKSSSLTIQIRDEEYHIEQSPSLLSSNTISSSTGYVTWKVSPPFLEWLLYHRSQPFFEKFNRQRMTTLDVLELGSGTAGIVASALGPRVGHFIASDQRGLIKSLMKNIVNNVHGFESSTVPETMMGQRGRSSKCTIDVIELDWEHPEEGIDKLSQLKFEPDIVIACDTIYNEFLIPHFVNTLRSVSNDRTLVLVAVHLRDLEIVDLFLKTCIKANFEVRHVDEDYLTDEMQNGFAIYCLKSL